MIRMVKTKTEPPSRFEIKYTLSTREAEYAENFLKIMGAVKDMAISKNNDHYIVNSVYFDSPILRDYQDKVAGIIKRKKIRLRWYENTIESGQNIWLEVKHKDDMRISKTRIKIPVNINPETEIDNQINQIMGVSKKIENEAIHFIAGENRAPSLFISYKRKPYLVYIHNEPVRITLDYDMICAKTRVNQISQHIQKIAEGETVMEVKYNQSLPAWFGILIRHLHLRRDSFSKYAKAIETIYKYHLSI